MRQWLLVLAGVGVYANSLSGAFVYDDLPSIVENDDVRRIVHPSMWGTWSSAPHSSIDGRPLVRLSLALNYAAGGLEVEGYHLFNIGVHLLCGLVLYGVVRRALQSERLAGRYGPAAEELALATALLWVVHPLNSECVNYISVRTESLMGLWYLLVLYSALGQGRRWQALAVLCSALGMATKESMVTAPLAVLLCDWSWRLEALSALLRRRWPLYVGLASTWGVLAALMGRGPRGDSVGAVGEVGAWEYALNQCRVLVDYLSKVVWPHPLALDYGYPHGLALAEVAPEALAVLGLLVVTGVALARQWPAGFAGAWFFLVLSPTSSFVPIATEVGAERRMYLPLAGVLALVVVGGHRLLERGLGTGRAGAVVLALVLALAVALGWATLRRNRDYRSPVRLWQSAVAAVPDNPRGHTNLGLALEEGGRVQEAIEHYGRALELDPGFSQARNNLGSALIALGQPAQAIAQLERALQARPDYLEAHFNLGVALRMAGRLEEAAVHLRRVLLVQPAMGAAHFNLGLALQETGESAQALYHLRRAVELRPEHAEAHYYLGLALEEGGERTAAREHYGRALERDPGHELARARLQATAQGQSTGERAP